MKTEAAGFLKINEIGSFLAGSSQKANFIKVLSAYEKLIEKDFHAEKAYAEKKESTPIIDAAEGFIGTPYKEMDCYEFVVGTLERTGVDYRGKKGIGAYLAATAKAKNLPFNSFMTGEGLMEATGDILYRKEVFPVEKPEILAGKIIAEMGENLAKGALLSFSMQSAGHTGFVSGEKNNWTYINSGRLDNNLREESLEKGVGEEPLKAELSNWLRRSIKKKEPLTITLGKFDERKLLAFYKGRKLFRSIA